MTHSASACLKSCSSQPVDIRHSRLPVGRQTLRRFGGPERARTSDGERVPYRLDVRYPVRSVHRRDGLALLADSGAGPLRSFGARTLHFVGSSGVAGCWARFVMAENMGTWAMELMHVLCAIDDLDTFDGNIGRSTRWPARSVRVRRLSPNCSPAGWRSPPSPSTTSRRGASRRDFR